MRVKNREAARPVVSIQSVEPTPADLPPFGFSFEPFVDAQIAADHLAIERRQVLDLTRSGKLPAHPVDPTAIRKVYRYKLSEIDAAIASAITQRALVQSGVSSNNIPRQPRGQRG